VAPAVDRALQEPRPLEHLDVLRRGASPVTVMNASIGAASVGVDPPQALGYGLDGRQRSGAGRRVAITAPIA
jgi:hypothetical protein